MTTPVAGESFSATFPVTGSGPFSIVLALVGLVSVGLSRLGRRDRGLLED